MQHVLAPPAFGSQHQTCRWPGTDTRPKVLHGGAWRMEHGAVSTTYQRQLALVVKMIGKSRAQRNGELCAPARGAWREHARDPPAYGVGRYEQSGLSWCGEHSRSLGQPHGRESVGKAHLRRHHSHGDWSWSCIELTRVGSDDKGSLPTADPPRRCQAGRRRRWATLGIGTDAFLLSCLLSSTRAAVGLEAISPRGSYCSARSSRTVSGRASLL